MYKLGLSADNMVDVKIEVNQNGRSLVRERVVALSYRGNTRVQMGRGYRIWQGTIAFDTMDECNFLRQMYRARNIYFQDNTTNGTGLPILVRWQGEAPPEYDEPTATSGRLPFTFEEVASSE